MKKKFMFLMLICGITLGFGSCTKPETEQKTEEQEKEKPTTYDDALTWKGLPIYTVDGEGTTISAEVNTNVAYSVSIVNEDGSECDWITYVPATKATQEAKDETIQFIVSEFPFSVEENRSAAVTISATGLKDQAFVVLQTPSVQLRLQASADQTRFSQDGGTMTVTIDATSSYTTDIDADWIKADSGNPTSGAGTAKFTIEPNTVKSDREGNVTFKTEGLEPVVIAVHQDPYQSTIGIKSVADFIEFVAASNNNKSDEASGKVRDFSKWINEDGEICLLTDLDLGSITEWTPICNPSDLTLVSKYCKSSDECNVFGKHDDYEGIFNGNGHTISNLHIKVDDNNETKSYSGFFGHLYNATVKNLVFDSSCTFEFNTAMDAGCAYGFLASSAVASTIENVKIYGTIKESYREHVNYTRVFVGGLVGGAWANGLGDMIIKDCVFDGKCEKVVSNTVASGTPHAIGGLIGFANLWSDTSTEGYEDGDASKTKRVRITNCENHTDITANIMRVGGIVGVAEDGVVIDGCKNSGTICIDAYDIDNDAATSNGRVGGIVAYDSSGDGKVDCEIKNCENTGNVIVLDKKSIPGGLVSVIAGISDYSGNKVNCTVAGSPDNTRGLFLGNVNNANASFSDNKAKGFVADAYSDGNFTNKVEITKDNFAQYVGKNGKESSTFGSGVYFWE